MAQKRAARCWQLTMKSRASDAVLRPAQQFYGSWDSYGLRLAWSGADWSSDGDLFIYFDTWNGGGATALYNPFATGETIGFPAGMVPDALLHVQDNATATLLVWGGAGWVSQTNLSADELVYDATTETLDLHVEYAQLGMAPGDSVDAAGGGE